MRIAYKLTAFIIASTVFLSGCWDRREIENNGIVLGVAIDYAAPQQGDMYDLAYTTEEAGTRKYRVTYELPMLKKRKGDTEEEPPKHSLYYGEGESVLAITRGIGAKTEFQLFFEDVQIIVFSEEVAKEGIGGVMDLFIRDSEMRRRSKMLVAAGKAENVLKAKLQTDQGINSLYISKIIRNVNKTPKFASKVDLGDISENIRQKRAFFMPLVLVENGDVKLSKAALFNKDMEMVGEVTEREVVGAKILRKALKQGVTVVTDPFNPSEIVTFELYEQNIKIDAVTQNDKILFLVTAKFVGNLGEKSNYKQDALNEEYLLAVERALEKEFTDEVYEAYQKQQQLKVEVCDLWHTVYRKYPDYWEEIQDRWDDDVFPTIPLDVKIKVTIRRPALTR